MARRKYMNGLKRHPSQYKSKSPMLHESVAQPKHQHKSGQNPNDIFETTLFDSIYIKDRVDPALIEMGYDPHTRVTKHPDGTTTKGSTQGSWASGSSTTVSKIPDNFQQMGKETKDNTFSRNMLAPEDYF